MKLFWIFADLTSSIYTMTRQKHFNFRANLFYELCIEKEVFRGGVRIGEKRCFDDSILFALFLHENEIERNRSIQVLLAFAFSAGKPKQKQTKI